MSDLNDIFGAASTLPSGVINPLGDAPEATILATGPSNDLDTLPIALAPVSFPPIKLGIIEQNPMFFWILPKDGVTSIPIKINDSIGSLTNGLTGATTAFGNNIPQIIPVVPEQWQRFSISANFPNGIFSIRFQTVGQPAGSIIPVLDGLKTGELFISVNYEILDFRVTTGIKFNRTEFPWTDVDGRTIDKLIIALAHGGRLNGTLIYNGTREANDSFRSGEAAAAMTILFANGWTITR